MKKLLILAYLHICFFSYSQTVIYQTSLSKEKPVIKYTYLPVVNKIVINEASSKGSTSALFNKSIEYDTNSNSKVIFDNSKYMYLFSSLNNQYFGNSIHESEFSPFKFSFFKDKEAINFEMKSHDFYIYGKDYFRTPFSYRPIIHFDNTFFYDITDEKGSNDINVGKENLSLIKFNISTQKSTLVPIIKPNVERLKAKDLVSINQIPFQSRFYNNNTFEIITKNVKEDYTSSSLYRSIYDFDGKLIREINYSYSFPKAYIVPSSSNSILENMTNSDISIEMKRATVLDYNDYFVDSNTKDFYIYGILDSNRSTSGAILKDPLGFYIIKYSDKGDKVWEKIYDISSTNGFKEHGQQNLKVWINVDQFCQKDTLSISICGKNNYSNYYNLFYLVNKESGNLIKSTSINNEVETNKGSMASGLSFSLFENYKYAKNKYFDTTTFLSSSFNDVIKKYIDKINSTKDVFFNSIVSSEGIWLIESDNETYYKVTFFKN